MLDFSNKFVCATREYTTYEHHVSAPLMRHSFNLCAKPDRAEILITALGFYDIYVNGKKITKGALAPYISNGDDVIYYDDYDLTDLLAEGENVIGLILGNGMQDPMVNICNFDKAPYTSSPKTAFSFRAECGDKMVVFDATSLKCAESSITFDNFRTGVFYDARREKDGWADIGYDDSGWRNVLMAEMPRGMAKLCMAEPITVREELAPVSVKKGELEPYTERKDVAAFVLGMDIPEHAMEHSGGYIYDFGKNTAGVFRFRIKNAGEGQKISFQCGEYLNDNGKIVYNNINFYADGYSQRDIYICRGGDEEVFVPSFTYHGCRYIYVHGIDEAQATPDALTFLVMSSDIKSRASFKCSDEMANRLFAMTQTSDLANFYYFPTDCPHREKNGWTGDAAASSEHMILTFSVENSYREWLTNIRAAQNIEGALPGIVPTAGWGFSWGNGPAWDRVLFDLPYMTYIYRGETGIIRENRHAMMRYLEYVSNRRNSDGLVAIGLGDWAPVGISGASSYIPKLEFTDSVMVYDMCVKAEKMFRAIGNNLDASYALALGKEMRKAIRTHLIDFTTMTVQSRSQTAQAMAIYYGIFEPSEYKEAARVLVRIIHEDGDEMNVGYLGARVVFHVLSDCGESELAYRMITKKGFPSYGYYAEMGLTSLPEIFRREISDCCSLNHHFFGDINHWFIRHVLGINVNPYGNNPNRIIIRPKFIASLDFAEGEYDAPAGKVYVRWERDGENINITVKCDNDLNVNVETELPEGYTFGLDNYYRNYKSGQGTFTAMPKKKCPNCSDFPRGRT